MASGTISKSEKNFNNKKLKISVIKKGQRGFAKNVVWTWGDLKDRLSDPEQDRKHTLPEYLELPIDRQNYLKDVGSFVGGHFLDGLRKNRNLEDRSLVTLDVDGATSADIRFFRRKSALLGYEFFASTTRKHTRERPRWRVIFPLTRTVDADEYTALSRILASHLFETEAASMDACDDVSFRQSQIMYWPSVCKDAEFDTIENFGELVDPDEVFDDFSFLKGDWRDFGNLPYSEKRGKARQVTGKDAEDPLTKKGLVGAFCRAYSVPDAIDEYLSDIYAPGNSDNRYTYLQGQSSNGAVVYDDGKFLQSFHGTDPCADKLVNAFDMVRIHLFGEDDEGNETPMSQRESFKSMFRLLKDDDRVQDELEEEGQDIDDYTPVADLFDDLGEDEDEPTEKRTPEKTVAEMFENLDDDEPESWSRDNILKTFEDLDVIAPVEEVLAAAAKAKVDMDRELFGADERTPPFPTHLLGTFWEKTVAQWSKMSGAPEDFCAASVLMGASALIGNTLRIGIDTGWTDPAILWSVIVGPSGTNKTPAINNLLRILNKLDRENEAEYESTRNDQESDEEVYQMRLAQWKKEVKALPLDVTDLPPKPAAPKQRTVKIAPRTYSTDATLAGLQHYLATYPKGSAYISDELLAWLTGMMKFGNNGASDRPTWLTAYEGQAANVLRRNVDAGGFSVPYFGVPVYGGTQNEKLMELLDGANDGLQGRFLYFCPPMHRKPKGRERKEEDPRVERAFRCINQIKMLCEDDGWQRYRVVPMTEKAREVFYDWKERTEKEEFRRKNAANDSMLSKSRGHVPRLALIVETLWWAEKQTQQDEFEQDFTPLIGPKTVSPEAVEAAIILRDKYFKPMMMYITRTVSMKTQNSTFEQISSKVRSAMLYGKWDENFEDGEFTITQMTNGTHRIVGFRQTNDVRAEIRHMVNDGWLEEVPAKKGRRGKRYRVTDRLKKIREKIEENNI